jgi:hypothetical protein
MDRVAGGGAGTVDGGALREGQVFDLHFRQFVGNEIPMVRRIYGHFGLDLHAEAEVRMQSFLAENPRDKHGGHRYTLAQAGLDAATERRRYAGYQERFGIASELVDDGPKVRSA